MYTAFIIIKQHWSWALKAHCHVWEAKSSLPGSVPQLFHKLLNKVMLVIERYQNMQSITACRVWCCIAADYSEGKPLSRAKSACNRGTGPTEEGSLVWWNPFCFTLCVWLDIYTLLTLETEHTTKHFGQKASAGNMMLWAMRFWGKPWVLAFFCMLHWHEARCTEGQKLFQYQQNLSVGPWQWFRALELGSDDQSMSS